MTVETKRLDSGHKIVSKINGVTVVAAIPDGADIEDVEQAYTDAELEARHIAGGIES